MTMSGTRYRDDGEDQLWELARSYGVLPAYRGIDGKPVQASRGSVISVLRSLGASLPEGAAAEDADLSPAVLARALSVRRSESWQQMIDPVIVAWDGLLESLMVRVPADLTGGLRFTLFMEDGSVVEWQVDGSDIDAVDGAEVGRRRYVACRAPAGPGGDAPQSLPHGRHRLILECGDRTAEAWVISAPRRCWGQAAPSRVSGDGDTPGAWGLFAPLYALRSDRDWGAGDLADLAALRRRVAAEGGSVVATLPLLAGPVGEPLDPSPYRPDSRLFWNELYLAVDHIPEWKQSVTVGRAMESEAAQARLRALRESDLVDYRGVMAFKRQVLEEMVGLFFAVGEPERHKAFAGWLEDRPEAFAYARYRAEREAGGEACERYHLYCQWQMDEQLGWSADAAPEGLLRDGATDGVAGLFLDLPVGVHPEGFDVWQWPGLFVKDMSVGAPPDAFFSLGQRWDSPPVSPEMSRGDGHRYFAACLRNHMRFAGFLRIDHAMSLHRLFWIPAGAPATDGVYVEYPAEELYAVLSLESHRNRSVVVGEDLGTVPPEVRPAMRRHGVSRTWVAQTSFRPRAADPLGAVPRGAVASVNTHDMVPLAGFLDGEDIRVRLETGQADEAGARRALAARTKLTARLHDWATCPSTGAGGKDEPSRKTFGLPSLFTPVSSSGPVDGSSLLAVIFDRLRRSDARLTLLNSEDLVAETSPQNIPGTGPERPNWRQKIRGRLVSPERAPDSTSTPDPAEG